MSTAPGTASDDLPGVRKSGRGDVTTVFVSLSARHEEGRDREYLEWHGLDHRPEQYRLAGLRHAERLVSTPDCRAVRAAQGPRYTDVDHVMTYFFADDADLAAFAALGAALREGGRMPIRLPSVELAVFEVAGRVAAPRVAVGADVVPWRPARGVHLLIEEGSASPAPLIDVPGVAGIWWYAGRKAPEPFRTDHRGLQLTALYLDDDPVVVAGSLEAALRERWVTGGTTPLLAAPFHPVVPYEWDRHLPTTRSREGPSQ